MTTPKKMESDEKPRMLSLLVAATTAVLSHLLGHAGGTDSYQYDVYNWTANATTA